MAEYISSGRVQHTRGTALWVKVGRSGNGFGSLVTTISLHFQGLGTVGRVDTGTRCRTG